ncbi:hypothetical protein RHGRI_004755 [Rhododendron griersonianum]|uniref:Uncharacterized protein n=1 Tax=Rhododendron griersonianum TaxID=479676 RepID=A0AAV6LBX8_9ERIC|nr:hypothetical protein RHGRI_018207 [Rhododendron griersonianum]KAG5561813.1 hypothetical protein RHGRI_004755 [Rhododendron griersonianum]
MDKTELFPFSLTCIPIHGFQKQSPPITSISQPFASHAFQNLSPSLTSIPQPFPAMPSFSSSSNVNEKYLPWFCFYVLTGRK